MNKKEIIGICEFLRVHHFENSYKLLDYYNKCNKQKEVLDKIKEYAEKYKITGVIAREENEHLKHILELLEEIE